MCVQKIAKFQSDFKRLSVCFSTIQEFHNKTHKFLDHHCICLLDISSKFSKILQLLRSSGNRHTHTQTDYYNPLPTLGLIIIYSTCTYTYTYTSCTCVMYMYMLTSYMYNITYWIIQTCIVTLWSINYYCRM